MAKKEINTKKQSDAKKYIKNYQWNLLGSQCQADEKRKNHGFLHYVGSVN
jgi:hypothetical protein